MAPTSRHADAIFRCRAIGEFNRRFFRLPEVRLYFAVLITAAVVALIRAESPGEIALPVAAVAVAYPAYEYALHRWLLHLAALCRSRLTARIWWRLHYRHHAAPLDASVIFGAPASMVAAALIGAGLVALPFGSWPAFAAAAAAAFGWAILYEYFHALAHSQVALSGGYLARMRRHHLMHHHLTDRHNYGVVTDLIDRMLGTAALREPGLGRSATAYNLGYTPEVAAAYPWVRELDREHRDGPDNPAPADARLRDSA